MSSISSSSSSRRNLGSESALEFCEICMEEQETEKMFTIARCFHSFCRDCVTKHVSAKIGDGGSFVPCPSLNCPNSIEFDREIVGKEVAEKWNKALCEAVITEAGTVVCPFKDCSAAMIVETQGAVRECECPICHRLFCARCGVPWHAEVTCEEFKELSEEERGRDVILMKKLASRMKWMRCPRCKVFVEKINGCLHITCRCRFEFCYACGSSWSSTHGGCQPNS